jgi:hypothetical protein
MSEINHFKVLCYIRFESASRPLVDFSVLNINLIK